MSNGISDPDDEYVGYGSPPKKSQFKVGNREYLKRRKKQKDDNLATIAQNFLEQPITYRDGHKLKRARPIDAYLKKLESRALKGDLEAIAQLMYIRENPKSFAALKKIILYITEDDEALLGQDHMRRKRERLGKGALELDG